MTHTVRAARLLRHGAPLQVQDVTLPEPGPAEVLVELLFAGVNPVDRYAVDGRVAPDGPLPRTAGSEACGTVAGQLVVVHGGGLGTTRDGVYAQAVIAPRDAVTEVPAGIAPEVAACVGVAGVTAYHLVTRASVGRSDRVLVLGAGGGVGLPVVSFAASVGAQVWGQVGSAGKVDAVRAAGAADVAVSDASGLADALGSWRPTVVVDPLGGPFVQVATELLPVGGRYIVFGTSAGAEVALNWQVVYRKSLQLLGYGGLSLTVDERRQGTRDALAAVAAGALHIPVQQAYPLDGVNDAFARLADRSVVGKLVVAL
ncbi:MAG TPA: zinc-binding alcohol dehydrogenase family protein [Mycobacteriales bacterium]|jgi:NADPH2:quinone reductase|nr:zinc-binding alcohol dehydrogenase family protein [Mycobacteriales bacterium]